MIPVCTSVGKRRRLERIISPASNRTIIVPVDDSLIFGPDAGLERLGSKLQNIMLGGPNAILSFIGSLRRFSDIIGSTAWIVNLTASIYGKHHTDKKMVASVEQACALSADAIAIHVNVTAETEPEMIAQMGTMARRCETFGMPLVAIMYPRRSINGKDDNYEELKQNDRDGYRALVAHCARIAMELGADIIKTQFTGDVDSFGRVVEAACGVPVVIAGGPMVDEDLALRHAREALEAGAAGVSFGRNVFSREDSAAFLGKLRILVHQDSHHVNQ